MTLERKTSRRLILDEGFESYMKYRLHDVEAVTEIEHPSSLTAKAKLVQVITEKCSVFILSYIYEEKHCFLIPFKYRWPKYKSPQPTFEAMHQDTVQSIYSHSEKVKT